MQLEKELIQYGLTPKEARIYLALLELGPSSILRLSKKTKITRTTLYHIVTNLIEKKFITQSFKGKKKLYLSESPEKIRESLKEKINKFNTLIPELSSLLNQDTSKPVFKYYEGLEGIKDVYRQSLKAKDHENLLAFIGVESLQVRDKAIINFWEKEYIPARKKKDIFFKIVIPDNELGLAFYKKDKDSHRESRLLPASSYNFECEIMIYDQVVSIFSYTSQESFALTIESKPIANTLKMIWQIAWNNAYELKNP